VYDVSSSRVGVAISLAAAETEQVAEAAAVDADVEHLRDLDASVDLRSSFVKQTPKSSSKSKKRSTDRKRKGSSWYNVRLAEFFVLLVSYHLAVFLVL